jgi:hypothetical protein
MGLGVPSLLMVRDETNFSFLAADVVLAVLLRCLAATRTLERQKVPKIPHLLPLRSVSYSRMDMNLIRRQWPSTRVYGQVGHLEGLEAGAQITSRTTDSTISGHPGAPNVIIRFDHAPK